MRFSLLFSLACTVAVAGCAARASNSSGSTAAGQVRMYYVAADEVPWDYVPGGRDNIAGAEFKSIGTSSMNERDARRGVNGLRRAVALPTWNAPTRYDASARERAQIS